MSRRAEMASEVEGIPSVSRFMKTAETGVPSWTPPIRRG